MFLSSHAPMCRCCLAADPAESGRPSMVTEICAASMSAWRGGPLPRQRTSSIGLHSSRDPSESIDVSRLLDGSRCRGSPEVHPCIDFGWEMEACTRVCASVGVCPWLWLFVPPPTPPRACPFRPVISCLLFLVFSPPFAFFFFVFPSLLPSFPSFLYIFPFSLLLFSSFPSSSGFCCWSLLPIPKKPPQGTKNIEGSHS